MDNLDETLRAAMKALDDRGPARAPEFFEQLASKVEARLARGAEDPMENTTTEGTGRASDGVPPTPTTDDSGLHDIKALAQTTRRRVSQRISSQHDIDESLLSSSQSGLRAVALPEPAKLVSLPSIEALASAEPSLARAAEKVAAHAAQAPGRRGRAPMMWIGGGAFAAAAAVIAFVAIGRGSKERESAADQRDMASGSAVGAPAVSQLAAAKSEATPRAAGQYHASVPASPTPTPTPPPSGTAAMAAVGSGSGSATDSGSGSATGAEDSRQDTMATTAGAGSAADAPGGGHVSKSEGGKLQPAPDKVRTHGKPEVKIGKDAVKGGAAVDGTKHKGGEPRSLDDLIDDAAGGPGAGTKKPAGDTKAVLDKKELTSSDIRTGMSSVAKRAQACFDKFGVSGTVGVKATVAPTGKITKTSATGAFAGTPTGDCVASAVSGVSFPPWDGPPMTVNYSYLLTE